MRVEYTLATINRFWAKVEKTSSCWFWRGRNNGIGYGRLSFGQKSLYAHRISYELAYGTIPEGMYVLHRCDTPPCVNPAHLFLGTAADNTADMVSKGRDAMTAHPERHVRGEQHPFAKLSHAIVDKAKKEYAAGDTTFAILAATYGVGKSTMREAVRGHTWGHS